MTDSDKPTPNLKPGPVVSVPYLTTFHDTREGVFLLRNGVVYKYDGIVFLEIPTKRDE